MALERQIAQLQGVVNLNMPGQAYPSSAWLKTNPTHEQTDAELQRLREAYDPENNMQYVKSIYI